MISMRQTKMRRARRGENDRRAQRGIAVILVLAVLSVLVVAGAIGAGLLTGNLRAAGGHRTAARAQYCAEAGLVAGRAFYLNNLGQLSAFLACPAGGACPA